MKVYNSKFRPITKEEPSGGGTVSFMSFERLASQVEGEISGDKKITKIVVEENGLNLYWENK